MFLLLFNYNTYSTLDEFFLKAPTVVAVFFLKAPTVLAVAVSVAVVGGFLGQ